MVVSDVEEARIYCFDVPRVVDLFLVRLENEGSVQLLGCERSKMSSAASADIYI